MEDQTKACISFRSEILEMEEELVLKRREVQSLRAEVEAERSRSQDLEGRIMNAEAANATLQRHIHEHQRYAKMLEDEMEEKDMLLNQGEIEIMRVRANEKTKRQVDREKLKKELDRYRQVESQLRQQNQRFRVLRDIIDAGAGSPSSTPRTTTSDTDIRSAASGTPALKPTASDPKLNGGPSLRGPAVSARKRRSRSADPGERWLDHRPSTTLDLDTVLQPHLGHAKSITKLVDPKDMTKGKVSKYVLTTQEQVIGMGKSIKQFFK